MGRLDYYSLGLLLFFVKVSLRLLPLQWSLLFFASRAHSKEKEADPEAAGILAGRIETRAASFPFHLSCLERSLALLWKLRHTGGGKLRIGVKKSPALAAHAWVECDGTIVNDTPDVVNSYRVLAEQRELAAGQFD